MEKRKGNILLDSSQRRLIYSMYKSNIITDRELLLLGTAWEDTLNMSSSDFDNNIKEAINNGKRSMKG